MSPRRQTSCRVWLSAAAAAALVSASAGCRFNVRFPAGTVRLNSNGVSVRIDGGSASGDSLRVDAPFVHVEVRE